MRKIKSFRKFKSKSSGPKGKDLTVFVRFGGLNVKKQKGYGKETYHAPPASRGFYAFPKVAQEMFLVGSLDVFQPGILPKDPDWNKMSDEDYEKHEKRRKKIYSSIRKEFKKTTGNIWHHLGEFCNLNDIIDRHGSWVKTSMDVWQKAFSKASLKQRYGEDFGTGTGRGEKSINATRGISGYYSKDHFEVFFDEKV